MIFVGCWLVYALLGWVSLKLLSEREGVAVFWPASGFAAGLATILSPPARWPIALAVATATLAANLTERASIPLISIFAMCNAAECLLFVTFFRFLDRSRSQLESFGSVVAFLSAATAAAAIAALPAAMALTLLGFASAPLYSVWFSWFRSDGLGIITFAPMLMLLPSAIRARIGRLTHIEGCTALAVALVAAFLVFAPALLPVSLLAIGPAPVMLPIFLWIAARLPPIYSGIELLGVSVVIALSALAGSDRFGGPNAPLDVRMFSANLSIVALALALLTLASLFAREKRTSAALNSSDQRLKLALKAGRMYAFDFDIKRGIVYRSGGIIDRFGLPAEGTLQNYYERMHPDDLEAFRLKRHGLSVAEPTFSSEYRMFTTKGETLVIQHNAEGVFDPAGQLVRLVGTCVDVTDRATARVAIEDRERQLKEALDAGRVYAFTFDANTNQAVRSDNAAEILGVSLETARNDSNLLTRMVHPDDRDILTSMRTHEHATRMPRRVVIRCLRTDGRMIWLELMAMPQFDATGKLLRIRGLTRDVTETRQSEMRRAHVVNELDHRVKNALDRMLGVITLSREGHTDLDSFVEGLERRILSMAKTQERLSHNKWDGVEVTTVVADELAPFRTSRNCWAKGPAFVLEPASAQAFSFTMHELATNASKHGALSTPHGTVDVNWRIDESPAGTRSLVLRWNEVCEKPVTPPAHTSYGLLTIQGILPHEVPGSTVNLAFEPHGLVCDITMPLAQPSAAGATAVATPDAATTARASGPSPG